MSETNNNPTIEIRSIGGRVLFVSSRSSVRVAVEEAVEKRADLRGADLRGADLSGADLSGADLSGAKNAELAIARINILPEGDLIAYKKCQGGRIVKLRIPADAKRSHASGRKCRAEFAEVLEITDASGSVVSEAFSCHDSRFRYEAGVVVRPTAAFDEDRWNECSTGIHFYISREEAVAHV